MSNHVNNIDLDDFLYEQGIELSGNEGATFSVMAFTERSKKILKWLVTVLGQDIRPHIHPVKVADTLPAARGYHALIMNALYKTRDFDVLVDALPEIKRLFAKQLERGYFS